MTKLKIELVIGACFASVLASVIVALHYQARGSDTDPHSISSTDSSSSQDVSTSQLNVPDESHILTKVTDYAIFNDPKSAYVRDDFYRAEDFLTRFSQSYRSMVASISAETQSIQDSELREAAKSQLREKTDRVAFINEAKASYLESRKQFFLSHEMGWFEMGHFTYDPNKQVLEVQSIDASPIMGEFELKISIADMDKVWSNFARVSDSDYQAEVASRTKSDREFLDRYTQGGGSDPTVIENLNQHLSDEPKTVKQEMRERRLVLVAQGSVLKQRIDQILFVDFNTETILGSSAAPEGLSDTLTWKFDTMFPKTISATNEE